MTVSSAQSRVSYSGDGVTTDFTVPFLFFDEADLEVTLVNAAAAETVQVLNSGYAVNGAGDPAGGTIAMTTAPAPGESLVIRRAVRLTQATDYLENDRLAAATLERDQDLRVMADQGLQEQLERSLKVPRAESLGTLPARIQRAGKVLGFDVSGDPIALSGLDRSTDSVTALGASVARTIAEHVSDGRLNVRDFGAAGDGLTDDTAAILLAQAQARLRDVELYFPAGIYIVSQTLGWQSGERWRGDGYDLSVLKWTAALEEGVKAAVPGSFSQRGQVLDLGFDGDHQVGHLLFLDGFQEWNFRGCEFTQAAGAAVYSYGVRDPDTGDKIPGDSNYNFFTFCRFLNSLDGCRLGGTDSATDSFTGRANNHVFVRCRFAGNSRYGMWVQRAAAVRVYAGNFVGTGTDPDPNAHGLRIDWSRGIYDVTIENNTGYGIWFNASGDAFGNIVRYYSGGSNDQGDVRDSLLENDVVNGSSGSRVPRPGNFIGLDREVLYTSTDGILVWRDSRDTESDPTDSSDHAIAGLGYALVRPDANQSVPDSTWTVLSWAADPNDAEHDTRDYYAPTGATRFKVPAGVSYVLLVANVEFESSATGLRGARFTRNDTTPVGYAQIERAASSSGTTTLNIASAVLPVHADDLVKVEVQQSSGGALDVLATSRTWFSILGVG